MKHFPFVNQTNVFCKDLNSLIKNNNTTKIPLGASALIPFVCSLIKQKRVLALNKKIIHSLLGSFDVNDASLSLFVSPLYKQKIVPLNIINYSDLVFSLSQNRCSCSWDEVSFFVVEKTIFEKISIGSFSFPGFSFDKNSNFSDLHGFLNKNGFLCVDNLVSPGDFVVRGGIVDVFPFNCLNPVRFSFLGGVSRVFSFNITTNYPLEQLGLFILYPLNNSAPILLKEKLCNKALHITYAQKELTVVNSGVSDGSVVLSGVGSFDLNKSFNHFKSIFVSSFLVEGAFVYLQKLLVLPSSSFNRSIDRPSNYMGWFEGDYFIHDKFGVCQFVGVENNVDNILSDRVCFKFCDGFVRLDVSLLDCVSFLAHNHSSLTLDSINSRAAWKRRRGFYKKKAQLYVESLLQSYACRKEARKIPCVLDPDMMALFKEGFLFTETQDQLTAMNEVFADLCSSKVMNRLLCGDVAFGKTEVALRSAFLAVVNNKRVFVLAPTTVLVEQLFFTFNSRFSSLGFSVGCVSSLSGLRSSVLADFKDDKYCILVGTHALLNDDKALSLCDYLIVDEEHRFGVRHKEKIFNINAQADVLYMSATPLPRSLQFALSNIRNISLIQSPPLSRKPINTSVCYFDDSLLKSIIKNELSRKSQIYVVDSSVYNVKKLFSLINDFFGLRGVEVLYSGLGSSVIKNTMARFRSGDARILVTTTIIESGLDIGAVNCIIINNAHLFGLSQLYQLRGRVGRSPRQANAYLLLPARSFSLSKNALSRLTSIKTNTALGSGYQIALEDLKIRGCGLLFGYKQNGPMSVGFEYYAKLIQCYLDARGGVGGLLPIIDLDRGFVPSSFVPSSNERVSYYAALFGCVSVLDVDVFKKSLLSRFGFLPLSFLGLIKNRRLALSLRPSFILSVKRSSDSVFVLVDKPLSFYKKQTFSKMSSFLNKEGVLFSFKSFDSRFELKYKQTSKDDYVLVESFSKFLL